MSNVINLSDVSRKHKTFGLVKVIKEKLENNFSRFVAARDTLLADAGREEPVYAALFAALDKFDAKEDGLDLFHLSTLVAGARESVQDPIVQGGTAVTSVREIELITNVRSDLMVRYPVKSNAKAFSVRIGTQKEMCDLPRKYDPMTALCDYNACVDAFSLKDGYLAEFVGTFMAHLLASDGVVVAEHEMDGEHYHCVVYAKASDHVQCCIINIDLVCMILNADALIPIAGPQEK